MEEIKLGDVIQVFEKETGFYISYTINGVGKREHYIDSDDFYESDMAKTLMDGILTFVSTLNGQLLLYVKC